MNWVLLTEVFVTLFVIMDPVGTIPIFLSLTGGRSAQVARRAAWQAVAVSFGVISAVRLLRPADPASTCTSRCRRSSAPAGCSCSWWPSSCSPARRRSPTATADTNVALVPLGTPLLAGPGAIVATMVFSKKVDDVTEFAAVALGVILVHVALWLSMRFSLPILRLIRESGVLLVTRIAGLLLSAIAVQMVADAVRAFIAGEG